MSKIKWTKYFMVRPGYSKCFVVSGIVKPVNLNNENYSIDFIKKLYDKGIKNLVLTEDGEARFNPKPVAPDKTTGKPRKAK